MSVQDFPYGIVYSSQYVKEAALLALMHEAPTLLDADVDGRIFIVDLSAQILLVADDND